MIKENEYQTIIIFKPGDDTIIGAEIKKFADIIQAYSETHAIKVDRIGEKKLAYILKGCETGYYTLFTFDACPADIPPLEAELIRDDHVLKFMTVKRNPEEEDFIDLDPLDSSPGEQDSPPHAVDALDVLLGLDSYNAEAVKSEQEDRDAGSDQSKEYVYALTESGVWDYEQHNNLKLYHNFSDALKEFDQWYKNAITDMQGWVDKDEVQYELTRIPESEQARAEICADGRSDEFYDKIIIEKMEVI